MDRIGRRRLGNRKQRRPLLGVDGGRRVGQLGGTRSSVAVGSLPVQRVSLPLTRGGGRRAGCALRLVGFGSVPRSWSLLPLPWRTVR
jgi:hypothetical protein